MRKASKFFIITVSTLVILASLLSLFYNLPYWYSKILDFPRLQYFILGILCLILFVVLNKRWKWPSILLVAGLVASLTIHSIRLFPYWFGEKTVEDAKSELVQEDTFSLMLANVLIKNKQASKFLDIVEKADPDMLLVMEVNQWWLDELETLKKDYSYVMEQPNDEAYGMALYSKFPLQGSQIKYLKHKNVPSFHTRVRLNSGKEFMLYAVHPVAPMPSDQYPDNVGEAEIELIKVGNLVAEQPLPAMVAGDFNDVAWSNTARLFGESGELNNVRIGRGLYNSFDAKSMILRWPLDHYYVSKEFEMIQLQILEKFGSDHFPIYAKFHLNL